MSEKCLLNLIYITKICSDIVMLLDVSFQAVGLSWRNILVVEVPDRNYHNKRPADQKQWVRALRRRKVGC